MPAATYECALYPGMEGCPGRFTAGTEQELWEHIRLHAKEAHGEDPNAWTPDEVRQMEEIIQRDGGK